MSDFIHLRAHSDHSVEEGLITPSQLAAKAAADGQGAIAMTDLNRMFGAIPFYKAARSAGVKPIIGADVWVEADRTQPLADGEAVRQPGRLLLLCETEEGYHRLLRWMSRAYLENSRLGKAAIKQSWLDEDGTDGVIALSGTPDTGEVVQALLETEGDGPASPGAQAEARRRLDYYKGVFPGRFFLEVQRYNQPREKECVSRLVDLAAATATPLVATHPIAFPDRGDYFLHEVRTCIASKEHVEDPGRASSFTREQYFRTRAEMEELFQDLPEALDNAAAVAARCSASIELGKNHLPAITGPNGEEPDEFLRLRARAGLEARLKALYPDEAERERERPRFSARLETELGIIIKMGFPSYYLIVEDFINWAKAHDVPVGPGRGSGAGSLVAYALNITDVEPLRYNLLFERFLNPERVSMPDFDIDFCQNHRGSVIEYVRQRYGADHVSQIGNVNTLGAKAAIKDVARTLGYTNNFSQMLSDLLSKTYKGTLDEALGLDDGAGRPGVPKLREKYDEDAGIRRLLDLARRVEGAPRTIGVHASGVLIAPKPVPEYTPQYVAEDGGDVVSQYDKDAVEAAGLVKFDFLGLSNLTIIKDALNHINRRPEFKDKPLVLDGLSLDDPEVFRTYQEGRLVGVFQMESEGMTRACTQLKPTCFEDIIALVSLYRPGPMALIPTYCRRKNGEEEVEYPDPRVEPILKETYGIMVYQEQVMQMAQIVGGYSLGGADLLRRAMGKKKPEEMAKHRAIFAEGAGKNGLTAEKAGSIFDLMERFAEYGFNKSHAAAYAMVSYQTAWLKTHYPAEYYAALMNMASTDTAALDGFVKDARAHGIRILPPDVNEGTASFEPAGDKAVRYGLAGLKGVGDKPIGAIVAAREAGGPFVSLFDFCQRMGRMAPKNIIQALARSGAFDSLHPNRASVFHSIADGQAYVAKLAKRAKEDGPLVPELFADAPAAPAVAKRARRKVAEIVPPVMSDVPEWGELERLEEEARAIGFALSGHPYTGYAEKLGGLKNALPLARVDQIEAAANDRTLYLVSGIVSDIREIPTRHGDKMAFVGIDDGSSTRPKRLTMFPDAWASNSNWIKKGVFLAASATIRPDNRGPGLGNDLAAEYAYGFEAMQEKVLESVSVVVDRMDLARLKAVLDRHQVAPAAADAPPPRAVPVSLYMPEGDDSYFRAVLSPVRPSQNLLVDLEATFGAEKVKGVHADGIVLESRPPKNNNKRGAAPGRRG